MKKITKGNRKSFLTFIGICLIIFSIFLVFYSRYSEKTNIQISDDKTEEYIINTSNEVEADVEEVIEEKQVAEKYDYIAVLEIPTINLKRGLVAYDSKYNSVKYNIKILDKSDMPDVKNGNLILAAHNGTSSVSFFNNLSAIKNGDAINVYYDGYKYIYKYNNSYEVDKNGKVQIVRDKTNNAITLITCKDNSDTKQVVYVGYLIEKTEY